MTVTDSGLVGRTAGSPCSWTWVTAQVEPPDLHDLPGLGHGSIRFG